MNETEYDFGVVKGPLIRGTDGSVGYDVYSAAEYLIPAGERRLIATNLFINFRDGYAGILKSRSSMALNYIDVCGGVIDTDYKGEIKVILHNSSKEPYLIKPNIRIAQLVIINNLAHGAYIKDNRGAGGFGSTLN